MRVVFQASTGKNLLGKEYGKFLRTDKHLASVSAGLRSHNLSQLVISQFYRKIRLMGESS